MNDKREVWVDYIKVLACILVLLGHFFQSMVKSNVLPDGEVYKWFNQTIYYFHVPLFFICSGYLYQKYSYCNSISDHFKNVLKKALVLGTPYFIFSVATWLLKTLFSNSVNAEVGSLWDALFINPLSPYWYLYILFFVFFITPVFKKKVVGFILIIIALLGKIFVIMGGGTICWRHIRFHWHMQTLGMVYYRYVNYNT